MLAGYLPFDDDPANPEGDNINLLYKYITTTPLTFPEYVTPHARDLLRRILVPDPRKRADLFEVARHSWLSEYHHVVSHITSSTTNIADIANSTVPSGRSSDLLVKNNTDCTSEAQQETPSLARSASVREPTKPQSTASPTVGGLNHHQGTIRPDEESEKSKSSRNPNRRTVQIEYVPPQSETVRGSGPSAAIATSSGAQPRSGDQAESPQTSKPLPQSPSMAQESRKVSEYPGQNSQQSMPPPSMRPQGVPRSVSEYTQAAGQPLQSNTARPSTGGSMTSTSGAIRLGSRGNSYNYGSPVAPTVATTNAQGRLAQPKNGKSYVMTGPLSSRPPTSDNSTGFPNAQQLPSKFNETPAQAPPPPLKGHKRSSTLSGLGEKLFGRSNSVAKKDTSSPKPKREKKYPPTSMKDPYPNEGRRMSTESRRSSSFGFGRKRSVDLESQEEKPRRFSLLPASFSLKGLTSGNRDSFVDPEAQSTSVDDFPQPPTSQGHGRLPSGPQRGASYGTDDSMPLGQDGQQDRYRGGRASGQYPSRHGASAPRATAPTNDVYGGTGVYNDPSANLAGRSYLQTAPTPPVERYREPSQHRPVYPDGFNSYDEPRTSVQQPRTGKGVLQKNNRKFAEAYDSEHGPGHHDGSSGAARKVMDFFRRRRTARSGDDR